MQSIPPASFRGVIIRTTFDRVLPHRLVMAVLMMTVVVVVVVVAISQDGCCRTDYDRAHDQGSPALVHHRAGRLRQVARFLPPGVPDDAAGALWQRPLERELFLPGDRQQ